MQVRDPSDQALLEGLRSGDASAFGLLFERYWSRVYGVAFRLVGSREEAEDLAQEAFLKLYRRPLAPEREHNVGGWLYRVATNLGRNALRSQRRLLARQGAAFQPGSDDSDAPLEVALEVEERRAVRAVLAEMPARQQACLVLRHAGLSYAEVAAALTVAPSSVGTLLARAESEFRRRYLAQRGGL